HTLPPEGFQHSRLPKNWGEDHLLPRQWDANGHARGILAPGGWIAQTDPDGKNWEILSSGYRNQYDVAFNADGELFVYDADMEWDMGMPWYRPTRVNHAPSGSELGWRSGTGKWPEYYTDSLPAMVNIGPGSPVGVEFGYGSRFPAKYQKALYICDWTFGTMYAIHIAPEGSSYKATKEEFLSRTPLPLTDAVINPVDGFMYFTVGGRGTQSELFRVRYVGKESTEPVEYRDPRDQKARDLRHQLESFHRRVENAENGIALALENLSNSDRFIRYAARLALEHQPVELWMPRIFASSDADTIIQGVIALARQGEKSEQGRLLATLGKLDFSSLDERRQLDLLRAYSLVFIRMGKPEEKVLATIAQRLESYFPSKSDSINRELCQVLTYCGSPRIVEKTVKLLQEPSRPLSQDGIDELLARNRGYGGSISSMMRNAPDLQKLAYIFTLRNAVAGWTLPLRKAYFAALEEARSKAGGASYQGFLRNIESDAYSNATDSDRLAIEAAGLRKPYQVKELPKPKGPGKKWTVADLVAMEPKLQQGRDFRNGQKMFAAARCVICHRFAGDGGATGPDLSQAAGRFSLKDMSEAIIEPSKVISDQYKASVVTTLTGKVITGRIVSEAEGKLTIVADPEDSTKAVVISKKDIETITPSPTSLMPGELLDTLNESEVMDLLSYVLSRGDPSHPMFRRR
ncbi:MAG: c-type cytochrome, partial [Gemmataceae bacterium]